MKFTETKVRLPLRLRLLPQVKLYFSLVLLLIGNVVLTGQELEPLTNEIIDAPLKTDAVIFETLDEADIERLSKIYGYQIFKNDSSRIFNASSIAKIPDSYVLGQGDEITISIFGASQYDAKLIVGPEGYAKPENMPRIFLKGLTWGKAKELIKSRFQRYYVFQKEQFALTLSQPRVITVNILGEVQRPGSYDLVATNTAFNALIAAGGPSVTGSFRNIRIIKDQEQIELDIYEIMNKPGAQFQFYLEDNIIIQVPVAQKIVEVRGAVKRPLKYELKEEEGLTELIDYAGGLTGNAYQEVVQIERFSENKQILIDIDLADLYEKKGNFPIMNGDLIRVKALAQSLENIVEVDGAVELPGNYALESTPRISDLLKKGILKKGARLDLAFLFRNNEDNTSEIIQLDLNDALENIGGDKDLLLKPKDKLTVYLQERYVDLYNVKVGGAVRDSIEFPFDPDSTITLHQAILLGGGLKPEAADFGYLIRTNPKNLKEKNYLKVNVRAAVNNPDGPENLILKPMDELRVVTQSAFTDVFEVAIKGAVRNPQTLQFDESLELKDLLTLANGFKPEASKQLEVFRLAIKNNEPTRTIVARFEVDDNYNIIGAQDFELRPNDEVVARTVPEYKQQALVQLNGEVIFPGEYGLIERNETLASVIQRAGGVTSEAFLEGITIRRDSQLVVTELAQALANKKSAYNLRLQDGDIITIPEKNDLVSIELANSGIIDLEKNDSTVAEQTIHVAYKAGKSAKWYINEFVAGFGENADKNKVIVKYANGGRKSVKKLGFLRKYPKPQKGATISIGAKPELTEGDLEKASADALLKKYPKLKKGVIISIDPELLNRGEGKLLLEKEEERPNPTKEINN